MIEIFYEAEEVVSEEQHDAREEADFCRVDVTALSKEQRTAVLAYFKELIPNGEYRKHTCFHEENRPCIVEPL